MSSQPNNLESTHSPDSRNLKRKVIGIVGSLGAVWAILGAIIIVSPSSAPSALMAGVAVSSISASIIGAE